jgi:hypothetical protein
MYPASLAAVLLLATMARAEDSLVPVDRPGFSIEVPGSFVIGQNPPEGVALEAWGPENTDSRALLWDMSIVIEPLRGVNAARGAIDTGVTDVARKIRLRYKSDLDEGPEIVPAEIPGADAARLIIYRTRERGLHCRRFGLYVHSGADVWVVSGLLRARAGSNVLAADYPALELLRKSTLSFRIVAQAATQPSTQATTGRSSK